jgi:hypothetical protein
VFERPELAPISYVQAYAAPTLTPTALAS